MTKTGIEELLKAIETVKILQETAAEQHRSIAKLEERLDKIDALMKELIKIVGSRSG